MPTFVLIHGSFHGGWCWSRVRARLRDAGWDVFAPSLTGLADRAHALTREVGLHTHIQDIVSLVEYEDLRDVILVGHSYGVVVATAVLHKISERLRHVVLLDAKAPEDGGSAWTQFSDDMRAGILRRMERAGSDWLAPPASLAALGIDDPSDIAWVEPRLTPMPLRAWTETVTLGNPAASAVPQTMICCTRGGARQVQRVRLQTQAAERGWSYHEIDSGHDAMITAPAELTALLLDAAGVS